MANKIVYPAVGGVILTMKRSGTIAAGCNVAVNADGQVIDAADANIHGIALDSGVEGIDADRITVLLFGNAVIEVSDIGSTAVGHYIKGDSDGTFVDDGVAKTASSRALVLDATRKQVVIL